uniref:Uncharacterized protein n=1 Tax=Strigamia maritima TaxID=126957 RepID=T1J1N6_STRMM
MTVQERIIISISRHSAEAEAIIAFSSSTLTELGNEELLFALFKMESRYPRERFAGLRKSFLTFIQIIISTADEIAKTALLLFSWLDHASGIRFLNDFVTNNDDLTRDWERGAWMKGEGKGSLGEGLRTSPRASCVTKGIDARSEKSGSMREWDKMEGWLGGWMVGWLGWDKMEGWLGGWVVGWLGGWVVGWLGGWLVGMG